MVTSEIGINYRSYMSQKRFLRNVSANSFQLIINQVFGLAIFYALSRGLDKNIFGQINWSLALLLTVFGILTFGIDQVMVNKIAAGYNRQTIFSAYFFHVVITGIIFYGLLLLLNTVFPHLLSQRTFLLFIGIGKLGIFFSTPFKQLAMALEKFNILFFMSIVSNILRGLALLILLLMHSMSVQNVLIIFITGDLTELLICILLSKPFLQDPNSFHWNKRRQVLLLKQSLPQTGVVLFTAIMSRFDWILVGLLISSASLAEYSFAYKIFEVSTLPLLVIAPIMIPLFTRLSKEPGKLDDMYFFLTWQIIIASFIALLLNICWIPVMDFVSDGKYGSVNSGTIFLFSLSMPILYFSNYLWTIHFAKGNLRFIFSVMAVAFAVNIISCSILIPLYGNEGAAFAYFTTVLVQTILYLRKNAIPLSSSRLYSLFLWPATALFCGFGVYRYFSNVMVAIILASAFFISVIFLSGQVRKKDWKTLQSSYQ
jgi:O-antigen/teichoic acid export membrane protein